jgi:hypothetical protein
MREHDRVFWGSRRVRASCQRSNRSTAQRGRALPNRLPRHAIALLPLHPLQRAHRYSVIIVPISIASFKRARFSTPD